MRTVVVESASVDDLAAEQRAIQDVVRAIAADDWLRPTPAWGWDVRDTIAHLADTDEMAIDTVRDGPHALNKVAGRSAAGEDTTYQGVLRGRRHRGADVLRWWEDTSAAEGDVLRALDPAARVPWGIGMRATSFVAARLMETWAHGLDVHAALGVAAQDTDRLAHVAWLATRALPYAFTVAGQEPPPDSLRVELTLPSGATWSYGPADAKARITGPAGEYCRVFVQRLPRRAATNVVADGAAAQRALAVARAYL
ncbi:MAG: maleylpyruvate isomerase family mycothiol-dependent enzyme [Actinomycetota bacterium]